MTRERSHKDVSLEEPAKLHDEEILKLLFTQEDRLPRVVVDEIIRRGARLISALWHIIGHEYSWQGGKDFWSVIHAAFITAAIGGREAVTPLLMSLRFAVAYDVDWVTEQLPSMFGNLGLVALEQLRQIAADRSNSWHARTRALEAMAAVTVNCPKQEREVFDFIASFTKDSFELDDVRGLAGNILLDFQQRRYEKSLLSFAVEQEELQRTNNHHYPIHFDTATVEECLDAPEKDIFWYTRDWLNFYQPEEIASRQRRWREERSWWRQRFAWLRSRWLIWQLKRELKSSQVADTHD